MAGSYADYPSYRMAYDRDGTQVFTINASNAVTQRTAGEILTLNNEADDGLSLFTTGGTASVAFIFPELRDLDGFVFLQSPSASYATDANTFAETSVDTTNGLDGTWVAYNTIGAVSATTAKPAFRTVTTATATGVRGFRIRSTSAGLKSFYPATVHLFGKPASGQNPNRLILWHPTLDQRVGAAYFDWGNVRRSDAATDRTFRVKNNSSTLTANGVSVGFDVLTDASPTLLAGQHSLSLDGTTFGNTVSIGAIAPGAISGTVTMRRTISSTAALSLWAARVVATATSWT